MFKHTYYVFQSKRLWTFFTTRLTLFILSEVSYMSFLRLPCEIIWNFPLSAKHPESDYIIQLGNFGYKNKKRGYLNLCLVRSCGRRKPIFINEQSDTHAYVYSIPLKGVQKAKSQRHTHGDVYSTPVASSFALFLIKIL